MCSWDFTKQKRQHFSLVETVYVFGNVYPCWKSDPDRPYVKTCLKKNLKVRSGAWAIVYSNTVNEIVHLSPLSSSHTRHRSCRETLMSTWCHLFISFFGGLWNDNESWRRGYDSDILWEFTEPPDQNEIRQVQVLEVIQRPTRDSGQLPRRGKLCLTEKSSDAE